MNKVEFYLKIVVWLVRPKNFWVMCLGIILRLFFFKIGFQFTQNNKQKNSKKQTKNPTEWFQFQIFLHKYPFLMEPEWYSMKIKH